MDMKHMNNNDMKKMDMKDCDMPEMKKNNKMDMSGMNMENCDMPGMTKNKKMNMSGGSDMSMHGMDMGNFKRRFWISLILTIPILFLSPMMGMELPFQVTFPGSDWIVLILATILFFYGGEPFFTGAWTELKSRKPAMMTLITMGISVAYLYSLWGFVNKTFINPAANQMNFFWELASLIVIMLLGHWIEMDAVMSAGNAVKKMAALLPNTAHLVQKNGQTKDVPLSEIKTGQEVIVQPGEKIPADGIVIGGQSAVNESLVTGESKAITKKTDSKVIGGSVNGDGTLTVKITATGNNGYLAQVMKLVENAQNEKSQVETLANRVSGWLFYAALSIGIIALIGWTLITGFSYGIERMVTVLVIACPHALGLAVPLVVARSTSIGAQNGLLIRHRDALEQVKKLDYVFLDKTGTLTEGVFKVNALKSTSSLSEKEVLSIFANLDANSSHPLAAGILSEAKRQKIAVNPAENVQAIQGVGLSGTIDKKNYMVVSPKYLQDNRITFDEKEYQKLANEGNSLSYLILNKKVLGLIAEGDVLRPQSIKMIRGLQKRNIKPVMLTGDNDLAAKRVAHELGDIEYHAELFPAEKEKILKKYQSQGNVVMMVGDGINDAPSLSRANIGVAIGAGTDVAIDSADVVLVSSNPYDIIEFLKLSKATNTKMIENLWWGAGYNIIAMPLAAGILAPVGIMLSPAVGAIIMSLSTIIVAINAFTLHMNK